MKNERTKKHTVLVTGERYERHCSGGLFKTTYRGDDLLKILKKVDEDHNYGTSEDDEKATVESILKDIELSNGDGCDCIFKLVIDGKTVFETEEFIADEVNVD